MSEEEQQLVESAEQEDHVGRVLESVRKCKELLKNISSEVEELQTINKKDLVQTLQLEHDDQKAIKELTRLLEKGGKLTRYVAEPTLLKSWDPVHGEKRSHIKPFFTRERKFGKSRYSHFYLIVKHNCFSVMEILQKLLEVTLSFKSHRLYKNDKGFKKALDKIFNKLNKSLSKLGLIWSIIDGKKVRGFCANLQIRRKKLSVVTRWEEGRTLLSNDEYNNLKVIFKAKGKKAALKMEEDLLVNKISYARSLEGRERGIIKMFSIIKGSVEDVIGLLSAVDETIVINKRSLDRATLDSL